MIFVIVIALLKVNKDDTRRALDELAYVSQTYWKISQKKTSSIKITTYFFSCICISIRWLRSQTFPYCKRISYSSSV